jgi:hypothetical protein
MADQIITLETGKLIPDRYNKRSYWPDSKWFYIDTTKELGYYLADVNDMDIDYPAPTQTKLAKWLRETHKIDVVPTFSEFGRTYGYKIYFIQNGETDFINHRYNKHETFEEAMEIALQEALKLIKTS